MPNIPLIPVLVLALAVSAPLGAEETTRQYTYAWPYLEDDAMAPRGGTSRGVPVRLATEPTDAWKRLREHGIDDVERDRRAILAMAGPYRTTFDFIETVGFTEGYTPAAPYQSWGTEYVYVVTDEPELISLQHILVMFIQMPDGAVSDPIVVKHWRQDWRYQERQLNVYTGHNTWAQRTLGRGEAKGRWTQMVYQVDDSPRYQAAGEWQHFANYSSWLSDETWRPLPRREFSVRDDYHVLIGTNRHTINPTGWVQEEENLKVVLDDDSSRKAVLAREVGLARYERIEDHDWTAGDRYWARTRAFWAVVRAVWSDTLNHNRRVRLRPEVDGRTLFATMFALAEESTADDAFNPQLTRARVESSLSAYLH